MRAENALHASQPISGPLVSVVDVLPPVAEANVATGVIGVVIWPVWFAMDAKGAAGVEMDALKARQQYLSSLAAQRCGSAPPKG